jgi:protein TonB
VTATPYHLAWSPEQGEKKRLLRIVSVVCPLFLLMAVYITWTELPEQKREELEKLPPSLAKVVLKKKELPKPVVKKKEELPKPEKKPEPKVAEKPKPEPKKPVPQVAKKPEPKVQPKPEAVKAAREKAKQSGLLAMSSQLSKLSALAETVKLDTPKTITAKPIARKVSDKLANNAVATTRSAGIDETQLTTETQTLSLAGRAETVVEQSEEVLAQVEAERVAVEQALASRSSEEIRRVMDANKSAINSIYNRALRRKPSLQGVVTPELVIEENGIVSSCSVVESTLNEPDLESKICNRLRLVNFGVKNGVDQKTVRYPIELLPS